ncbi:MAG: ribulokinase [Rhodobacteraceae bacterium]|nr:ribulokinase [Paracoccaceae bacterium]
MEERNFSIGLDYGTNSVRAIIVDCANGETIGSAVVGYPSGHQGVLLDRENHNVARQNPADYLFGLETSVAAALEQAAEHEGFDPARVIGIGVDTTGSSPMPVDASNRPLSMTPAFEGNLNAMCWLWKDHTSWREAEAFTRIAREIRPEYLDICGGTYSSEWWWAKIWHCLVAAPDVFAAAASWVELADWVPSVLAGRDDPADIVRGVCAAGHKGLYNAAWNGLPDAEFLARLDPALADLRGRLYATAHDLDTPAGALCKDWADRLGLREGIAIAIGAFDNHYGSIGCGISEGVLVKVIGTSTCDCAVVTPENNPGTIPGVCGIVEGSILPRVYGIEAGQSAVGDLFKWWVEGVCEGDAATHEVLTIEAAHLAPGQSGLLALDWNNGNRTILVDQRLTGLILGQTLHTSRADIYRALIEATAFGARAILERIRDCGTRVDTIICAGGIAEKNAMLMQIYADVLKTPLRVTTSQQTCALGAAIGAAYAGGAHATLDDAVAAMTGLGDTTYTPEPAHSAIYDKLYALYRDLHDAFGGVTRSADLSQVMKELIDIKATALTPKSKENE